jgi:hypothetical protein
MLVDLAIYGTTAISFFLLVLGTLRTKSESEIKRHVGLGNIGAAIYLLLLTCLVAYLNP